MGESKLGSGDDPISGSQLASDTVFLDTLFRLLANQRRRHALECLREYQTPIALADLADEIAMREKEKSLPEIPAEEVKRIYMSLYHSHIPMLEDANIVEYSQERDQVAFSPESEHMRRFLEHITNHQNRTQILKQLEWRVAELREEQE